MRQLTLLTMLGLVALTACAPRSGYKIEFTGISPTEEGYTRRFDGKVYGEGYSGKVVTNEFEREFNLLLDEFLKFGQKPQKPQ